MHAYTPGLEQPYECTIGLHAWPGHCPTTFDVIYIYTKLTSKYTVNQSFIDYYYE